MNSVLKKLWYPSEEDVIGSGMLFTIFLPVLLLLVIFLNSSLFFWGGFVLISVIRNVLVIRGSMILPIPDSLVAKFHDRSEKNVNIFRVIVFALPILSLISLMVIPNYFYIPYFISVTLSLCFLSNTRILPVFYTIIFSVLFLSALTVLILQGNMFWVIIYFIFTFWVVPTFIAEYVKANRIRINHNS